MPDGLSGWVAYIWGKSLWSEDEGVSFPATLCIRGIGSASSPIAGELDNVELSVKWRFAGRRALSPVYARASAMSMWRRSKEADDCLTRD